MEVEVDKNWSEKVEDLVESGDTDAAISLLESLIPNLERQTLTLTPTPHSSHSQLVTALLELSKLYSSKGLSLKSDHIRARASSINLRSPPNHHYFISSSSSTNHGDSQCPSSSTDIVASSDDDWEAIADRAPDELLSPPCMPEVSKLSLGVTEVKKVANRRGRETFSYKKQGLYSDDQTNDSFSCDGSDEILHEKYQQSSEARNSREAYSSVHCSFKIRVLEEDDPIMSSISVKDLDPPRQRPKTSARTAQRLIAQELGVKLPSSFGSKELRKQEDARRNRIVNRQILRDEAWGPGDLK